MSVNTKITQGNQLPKINGPSYTNTVELFFFASEQLKLITAAT